MTALRTVTRRATTGAAVGATVLAMALAGAGPAMAQSPAPPTGSAQPGGTAPSTGSAPPTGSAQSSPQQATPNERAAADVRPAIVYLTETFTAYVGDGKGNYFNGGQPLEIDATCTGFGVNPDGYVATAGHCVDTTSPSSDIRKDFVTEVAQSLVADDPGSSLDDTVDYGMANWTVEGSTKGSPIDSSISVVSGSLDGGATGRSQPARLVDFRPFDQGDVALLKVETSDLPSILLATDADVQIGTPVLTVGYPASADAATDPTLEPSDKDGTVSSKKTVGAVPVYEVSSALTPGMSGGPTVDMQGRVLGINSFLINGEASFNFIAPSSGLTELLGRNGVKNEQGSEDRTYQDALNNYYAGHYSDAIAGFDKLLQVDPQHAQALQFRTAAAKAKERFGDAAAPQPQRQAPAPAPTSDGPLGLSAGLFWSLVGGGVAVLAGLTVLLVALRRRRRPAGGAALPPVPPQPNFPQPGFLQQGSAPQAPGQPVFDRVPQVPQVPQPRDGRLVDAPAPARTGTNGATAAPTVLLNRPELPSCGRCGVRMDPDAHFCASCGTARG